jgi:transcriptional regulator with XRE-family HTH domain
MNLNDIRKKLSEARGTFDYRLEKTLFELGENICVLLEKQGISRTDLARTMDVSPAYVTKLLNGNPNLTIKSLLKLSDALGQNLAIQFAPKVESAHFSTAVHAMISLPASTEYECTYLPYTDSTVNEAPVAEASNEFALAA